jgi:T5SS/PEP-CTERM-associated repeat protein
VGDFGTGTLAISSGGAVSNTMGILGYDVNGTGTVTVEGAGSTWSNSAELRVGDFGIGNLGISNGGVVSSTSGFLGFYAGGVGIATVAGAGSTWTNSADLYVGGDSTASGGAGLLSVNTGGTVDVAGELSVWQTGTVNLNGGTINVGSLAVEVQPSCFSEFCPAATGFNFNAGALNIGDDLLLDTTGPLGNDIALSGFKSLGVAGTTTLNGFSTLSVDGGVFSTGSLVNNGGFALNSGTFNLTGDDLMIGAGGLLGSSLQAGTNQNINVTNTTTVAASGLLYVNGGSFSSGNLINNGQVAVNGLLSNLGGAISNNGLLDGDGRISAVLTNNAGGEVQVGSGDTLRFTAAGNSNSGQINLSGGTARFDEDLDNMAGGVIAGRGALYANGGLTNQGDINLSSGTTDVHGDVNNTAGGAIIVSGNGTATFFGDVVHNGTEIRVSTGSSAVFFGAVSGAGGYTGSGSVFFEGGLNPGNSPNLIDMTGDMGLGLNSHTTFELGGILRGSEYDAFDIGGTLSLGGELEVALYDLGGGLFAPQFGDSFDLFHAETINGDFDVLTLGLLGNGLGWDVSFLADEIGSIDVLRLSVVSAVPVPAAAWLFGSSLLGLLAIGRRRRAA